MPIKINTVSTIKKQLQSLSKEVLIEHCLRMAKYKKDNKELLNYLLFEQEYEEEYVNEIKTDIKTAFAQINHDTFFYAKKNIRRIHKMTTKHIKHSGKKVSEIELLIFFCLQMQNCGVSFHESRVMTNLYQRQITNIEKALRILHEDIRIDYEEELDEVKKGLI